MRRRSPRKGVSNIVAVVFLVAIVLAVTGFLYVTFQNISDAVSSMTAQLAAINRAGRVTLAAISVKVTSSSITLTLVNQGSSDVILIRYYVREYETNRRWEGALSYFIPAGGTETVNITGNFNSSASYLIVLISESGGIYRFSYPQPVRPQPPAEVGYSLIYAPQVIEGYTVAAGGYNSTPSQPIPYDDYESLVGEPISTDPPTIEAQRTTAYMFPDFREWRYYKKIVIQERTGTDLRDYQVKIELNTSNFDFNLANPDGSDIRFIWTDRRTLLNYWIEKWNSTYAKIWVKVPLLRGGENITIYMLYGNPDATEYDPTHYGLTKVMETLPADDGPNYIIYYEPWVTNEQGITEEGELYANFPSDNTCIQYDLPYTFPYYNTSYTHISICDNGYINMTYSEISDPISTLNKLKTSKIVAPLWYDLYIGQIYVLYVFDIQVSLYVDDVSLSFDNDVVNGQLIRWVQTLSWRRRVINLADFDVILLKNGIILFEYGEIIGSVGSDNTPVVGVSSGDGLHYTNLSDEGEPLYYWSLHNRTVLWPRKLAWDFVSVEDEDPRVYVIPSNSSYFSNAVDAYVASLGLYWNNLASSSVLDYSIDLGISGPSGDYYVFVQLNTSSSKELIDWFVVSSGDVSIGGDIDAFTPDRSLALIVNVSLIVGDSSPATSSFDLSLYGADIRVRHFDDPLLLIALNESSSLFIYDVVSSNWYNVSLGGVLLNPAVTFDYNRGFFLIVNSTNMLAYDPHEGTVSHLFSLPVASSDGAQVEVAGDRVIFVPGGGFPDIIILDESGDVLGVLDSGVSIGQYSCSASDPVNGRVYVYVGYSGRLLVVNASAGAISSLVLDPAPPTAYPVGMDYGQGYLWVIGRGGGIHYIDPITGEVRAASTQLPYYPMSEGDRLAYFTISGSPYLYHVREDGTSEVWVIAVP